jgi:hypothetical protein
VEKVETLFREGRSREAVMSAYSGAETDVRRSFGLTLPPQWTHREFLRKYLRADMGLVQVLLPQLYAIFEPVRYGGANEVPEPLVMDLLRSLYQEPALRRLPNASGSAQGTLPAGRAGPTTRSPTSDGGSRRGSG